MFTSSQLRTSAFLSLLSGFLASNAVNASPVMSSRQNNGASKYVSPLDNWTTTGCVQDGWPNNRVLEGAGYLGSGSLTIQQCLQYCDTQGAHLAGVEAGNQCFCGPTLLNGGLVGPNGANLNNNVNDGCDVNASGSNGSQNGGGQNHLLLFTSTTRPEPTIATVQGAKYQGCYKDNEANRLLPVWAQGNDAGNTASKCAEECKSLDSSYDLFGVEYRQECHCARSSEVNLRQDLLGEGCVQTCTGDEGTICGGGGWLSVYRSD